MGRGARFERWKRSTSQHSSPTFAYRRVIGWTHSRALAARPHHTAGAASAADLSPADPPGQMLFEGFLKPLGISQSALVMQLGASSPRLNEVIIAKRRATPDTTLRLTPVSGMLADFWLGRQQHWDLSHPLRSTETGQIRTHDAEESGGIVCSDRSNYFAKSLNVRPAHPKDMICLQ
jgi:antitoxin HigA-1